MSPQATRSTPKTRSSRSSPTRPRWTCPAPSAGTVTEVLVKVGDSVSRGTPILYLAPGDGAVTSPPSLVEQQEPAPAHRRAGGQRGGRARRGAARGQHPVGGCGAARGARRSFGAADGPRAGDRPVRGDGERAEGPHHQGRPAVVPAGPRAARRRCGDRGRRVRGSRRSRRRTSASSARSRPASCRGSRRCPARSCTARG